MPNDSAFKKTEIILMAVLAIVAMTLVTVAVVPALRGKVRDVFTSSHRDVLAKVSGKVGPQGPFITVLKIKSANSLSLEVYTTDETGNLSLMTKIPLFESRDGHFLLQGNATNLALTDVDKDGTLEIVAPTYDDQMIPRLNIFRFNADSKAFDRVSAPDDFKP